MKTLKTKELTEIAGVSSRTLYRYVKKGWLPKPQFKSFGRYGGSNFWLKSTVKQLLTIKSLKQAGCKNTDIDKILKGVKNV
jgi:DNA-binding transcriptional MerR regulator